MSDKDTGGSAFPTTDANYQSDWCEPGMTLRDYFALNMPHDEMRDLTYRTLSREAQEELAGIKHPTEPASTFSGGRPAEYFIELLKFNAKVNAAIRFIAADAMIQARKK